MPEPESLPRPTRLGARVDVVLVALAVAVAGLAASFVARNSDLWLHLAAGRLVAAGEYRFGADPFADTNQYWANHAWLFDLGLYLAFHHLGPAALVALKAGAAALTAALMLATVRGRAPVWLAAFSVLLAATAMAPRLLLQPAAASYLLLAACLYCLNAGGRALRAVPLLVALWVNLDGWFLLGPLLIGLFALGGRLEGVSEPWPKWLIPATLAAGLLSPHHVHALTVPPELSLDVWASDFPLDPRFAGVFASPWHAAPLGAAGGYNLAAWAFVALLALGAVSFALNRRAVRTWRGPVWVAFALLAAWQVRLVPFFAVVAAPVLALNLAEVLRPGALVRTGRTVALLLGAALAATGWFGKLTGFHNRDRGAAWGIHTDPTLERTASAVAAWRAGAADAKLFTAHPDVGHYLAWFAPGVRSSVDSRLTLFAANTSEYRGLSRALGLLPDEEGKRGSAPFVERGISAIVVYDPDARRMTGAVRELAVGPWDVLDVTGAVLAVPKGGPSAAPRFDPERAAFGASPVTADDGPAALPEAPVWWVPRRETGRRGSWEADAAAVYLRLAESTPDRSPALPLLALRAARRGAEHDPADANAWLVAARAAMILDSRTWELDAGELLTPLSVVRHVAAVGGLLQAARLNPAAALPHETLAGVFARRGFADLAHRHAAEAHRLVARAGDGGERLEHAAELAETTDRARLDAENRYLVRTDGLAGDPLARARTASELGLPQKAIDALLGSHPDLYGVEGLSMLADLLLQTGQLAEARALLDRAEIRRSPAALGQFTLPGRTPSGPAPWVYRFPGADWYDLCESAAAGRYPAARAAIDRIGAHLATEEARFTPPVTAALAGQVARTAGYAATLPVVGGLGAVPLVPTAARESQRIGAFHAQVRFLSSARADLAVLSGVLELERGDAAGAAGRFRAALALYAAVREVAPALPGEPLAKRYLDQIDRHAGAALRR